jgi:23S rRNA (uracil-5-)-methyltransferase RumA
MSLKNQIIKVKAEKIVFPGLTLARCSDGIALFVQGLLPNESAEVLVIKDKKSFREGILKNILERVPERIEPKCPLFGLCGGCAFQHSGYTNQVKYKLEYVKELLLPVAQNIDTLIQNPISLKPWGYRNKMEFSFFDDDGRVGLGLHRKGAFNKYVSVAECFICDGSFMPIMNIAADFANEKGLSVYDNKSHQGFLRHLVLRRGDGQTLVNLVAAGDALGACIDELKDKLSVLAGSFYLTQNSSKSDAVSADTISLINGDEFIFERLNVGGCDFTFKISPFSFFQTNSKGAEALYNAVLNLLEPSGDEVLLDLYCGTGTISIAMSKRVKKVVGIEISAQSVADAKENSALNNADNAEFFCGTAQEWVKSADIHFDAVILDPPRAGITKEVISFLLTNQPKKIIYVSCNPATLARDLKFLVDDKYEIRDILPIDMFPQTYHIETVVLCERI